MKSKIFRTVTIITLVLCIFSSVALARSSSYIESSSGYAYKSGTNEFNVNFSITGTGVMTSIGATKIEIKTSNGLLIKTFYSNVESNMMGSNKVYHSVTVTYRGVTGKSYYAVIYFKAANSSGYDTTTYTTNTVAI